MQTDFFSDGATTKGDKPNSIATLTAQKDGWGRVRQLLRGFEKVLKEVDMVKLS
ncbi:hypothetical protein [Nostoc sp.]